MLKWLETELGRKRPLLKTSHPVGKGGRHGSLSSSELAVASSHARLFSQRPVSWRSAHRGSFGAASEERNLVRHKPPPCRPCFLSLLFFKDCHRGFLVPRLRDEVSAHLSFMIHGRHSSARRLIFKKHLVRVPAGQFGQGPSSLDCGGLRILGAKIGPQGATRTGRSHADVDCALYAACSSTFR